MPCSSGSLELVRERLLALKVLHTGVVVGAVGVELSQRRSVGEPVLPKTPLRSRCPIAAVLVSKRMKSVRWLTGAREK